MQELLWYALSHGVTRPVPGQDVPLWFAVLLILGLLGAGALLGTGAIQWSRGRHERRASVPGFPGRQPYGSVTVKSPRDAVPRERPPIRGD